MCIGRSFGPTQFGAAETLTERVPSCLGSTAGRGTWQANGPAGSEAHGEQGARAMPWWQRRAGHTDTRTGESVGADVTTVDDLVVARSPVVAPVTLSKVAEA